MESVSNPIIENNINENEVDQTNREGTELKLNKLNFPKRKFAIIHGYNGHDYCGNQKYFLIIIF